MYIVESLRENILDEPKEEVPSVGSPVLNFTRCNVFSTKQGRDNLLNSPLILQYLSSDYLVEYWEGNCENYNNLRPQEFNISGKIRSVSFPIFAWSGDQDMFDPILSKNNLLKFGSHVEFDIYNGWAHDFGLDTKKGVEIIRSKVQTFLNSL